MTDEMPETYWFIFHNGALLLRENGRLPWGKEAPVPAEGDSPILHIPDYDGRPCRTFTAKDGIVPSGYSYTGLRETFDILPSDLYALASKSHELLFWDRHSRYCGICGAPMVFHTDISKCCTKCGQEVWPALQIAIIVAVTRGNEEILLVQSRNFKHDYMGLVAGFVETGETLEECVRREVMEETGITISDITYFASQPWPYPCGLMVGFKAKYVEGDVHLQLSELKKGGWFRRDNMPDIPGKVSLARRLIDDWLYGKSDSIRE